MPEEEVKLGDYRGFLKALRVDSEGNYVEPAAPSFTIATDMAPAPEAKYDQGLNLFTEDVDALRRSNQSSWDVVENAFQNAGATALMEIPEGIGYIGTGVANLFGNVWQEDSNGFIDTQNSLSTWARQTKESMIESNPIYAREEDQNFDPFNAMSWATNAGSIGSTISLLIPGMAIGRGAGFLATKAASRLVGLSKIGKASAKVTGAIRTAEQVAAATKAQIKATNIVGKAGNIAGTTAATLSSRHAENMLEGFGTYDQSLTESLMENYDMSYDQAKAESAFLLANPESALTSKYKEDYLKAADAAAKTTTWNWAAGTMDYAQYAMAFGGLNKLFKVGGAATRGANKASKLANYAKKGWNSSRKLAFQAGSEALEETYQAVVGQEALREGKMFEEGFSERLDGYLASEELQSAAMMGAVMGGGFHTMGAVFNKASGKVNDKLLQYEALSKLKQKDGALGVKNFGLGAIIQRDINLNGNLNNVIKSLTKFSKTQEETTDEFTQTVEMINGLNEQVLRMSSEVDEKGNAAYTPSQLADIATYSFIAQKAIQDGRIINTEIDNTYQQLEKEGGITSPEVTNHRNYIEREAIIRFLGAKKGKPDAAEQKFLDSLKERKLQLDETIKADNKPFKKTLKDGSLLSKQFTALNQGMISESYRSKVGKLQTAKGFEENEVVKAQLREEAKAKEQAGTVAGYSDRTQKATTVEEVEAIKTEEKEQIGGEPENTNRTTTIALLTEMPKVKAILENKELSPEDKIKNLATLLQGNAAAHHRAIPEFGDTLNITLDNDPQKAAEQLVTNYNELQAPNNPDPRKDLLNSLLNQKLSEEVGQEVEDAPDVNTKETNTSTFDSNAETIETSTDESFVGNLLHLAGPEGEVERGDDGTPLNHIFYDFQTKGDKSIDKHLNPKFKVKGEKVSYVIDGTDEYNQGDRGDSKRTYRIEMFVNVNEEEIFIGVIPEYRGKGKNRKKVAPELRKAIESEYENSGARDAGDRFTSEKKGQVKSKLPGRILNLPNGGFADLNTILEKYPNVKLITTVVTNGNVKLAGLEEAGLIPDNLVIKNSENLAAAGKNKEGKTILKGGYVYALVPAPDGRYFPVRLFTKKVGEVDSLKNTVSNLVDGLYDSNPEVAKEALSQLKNLIHINRDKSNFKIELEEGVVLVNSQEAEQEKLKEALLSTEEGKGTIAFIDKAKINSGNYNTDVAEYLDHNMDVSVGIHSPSYKVNVQSAAPVTQPSERSEETIADETATGATTEQASKESSRLQKRIDKAKSDFASATDIGGKVKAVTNFLNNATASTASVSKEDMAWYRASKAELEAEGYVFDGEIGREVSDSEIIEIGNRRESDQVPKGVMIIDRVSKPKRLVNGKQVERPIYDVIEGTGTTAEREALAAEVESIEDSMTPQNIKETRPKLAAANKALQDYDAANFTSPIQTEINTKTEETVEQGETQDLVSFIKGTTAEVKVKELETERDKKLDNIGTIDKGSYYETSNEGYYFRLNPDFSFKEVGMYVKGDYVSYPGMAGAKWKTETESVPLKRLEKKIPEIKEQVKRILESEESQRKTINEKYKKLIAEAKEAQSTQQSEEAAKELDSAVEDSGALDISGDFKTSVISEEEVNSAEDVEDEINFISNVLGGDALVQTYVDEGELVGDIPTVAGLVQQVKSKGQVLEGLFTEAGIYLRTKGTKGRGYHEAFHAVFTLGLTSTQREQVLADARNRYNDTTSTDLEIEEKLAEEFRVLMISNKALSGLKGALKRFMYALKDAINHLFNRTSPLNVDRLFGDIEIGKFRNKIQFKKEFKVFKPMASEVKSEGISNAHVKEYKDLYRHLVSRVLATVKAQDGYEGLTSTQALRKAATNRRGDVVLFLNDTIFNHMIKERNNSTEEADKVEINNFLLNYFSFEKVDGKLVTSKKGKMSAMLADSIFSLRDYGIVINPNIQEIVTLEDNVDIEEAFEGAEEAEEKDNFFRSRMEEDNRQRIPSTVRTKLHTIPKLDKEGNKTYSPIMGTVQYYDGEAVISSLESSISNSHSVGHMIEKLEKLNQPWVPQLLQLAQEKEIQSTLWTGIGDNQFIKYFGVDNKGKIYLANRKTLKTIVRDTLASAYTVDSNPYLNNEAKGKEALEEFTEIRKEIRDFSNNDASDETLSPILDKLANLLERSFIPLNREGLDALMGFSSLFPSLKSKATNFNEGTLLQLNSIYADMSNGRNPFSVLPKIGTSVRSTLENFAKDYAEISDLKVQPVFFGANKKPKYSLVESNYLSKLITLIQKNPKEFKNNVKGYLADMPIMDDLKDIDIYLLENTATEKSGKRSYLDISPEELNRANMNAFFNNKFGKNNMGLFSIPIPSDSKMLYYLQFPKQTTEGAVTKLAQVAIAEQRRIDEFAHENNSGVRNISNIEKNRKNFQYFPFLNNVKFKITKENEGQIKDAIRNYLEEEYETFVSKLKEFGQTDRISDGREVWESRKEGLTLKSFTEFANSNTGGLIKLANGESIRILNGKGDLELTGQEVKKFNISGFTDLGSLKDSKFIPSGEKEAAKNYFYNAFYHNTQITELVHKSPAYYKGVADFFKRVKQGNTNGTSPAESITAKVKVKADVLAENSSEEKVALKKAGKKDKTTQDLIEKAENNTTDGATFISMAKYKEYMEAIQQWDADKEVAYGKYLKAAKNWKPGTAFKNPLTAKENQDLFKGFKPFMFTEREVKNDDGISIGTSSPVQLKNSIQVLTPELVVLGGNAGNLAEAYNEMYVNEEKADLIAFSSAVKVGNPGVDQIMEVNLKDMLLAQNTPSHWYEHVARIGSQMRVHQMNNIALEANYNLKGENVKGADLLVLLNKLTEANLKEDNERLTSIINNSEEDYQVLRQEIVKVLTNRGAPTAIINSINDSIEVSDKEIIPKLYSSYGSKEAESVVAALFKSRVFKQKLPGGQFVNFTSYGLSDNLEYKVDETANKLTMEAYLPAWSKDLLDLPVKEDGTVDMSKVDPEVLELVGFRTPTESKYSIVAIEVKGFLPANLGGNIVLPKGITSRTGLDFDIDKMFVFTPHNTTQKEIDKVVVDESFEVDKGPNQSRKARENGLISIYYAISSNLKSHGEESIGPGHFENLKEAAYTAYLKNNVSDHKAKSAGELSGMSIKEKGEIIEEEEAKKYNIANPSTQLEFYNRIQSGGNLIGVLVNHLINNIKSKSTSLELKDPITINGQEYKSLSSNNMDIDYRLQEFATAIVDNTKDPLAAFINLNINTADAYMAAIRLGLPIDYTVALFSTPLAIKLYNSSKTTGKPFLVEAQKALTELQGERKEGSESSGGYTNLNLEDLFDSTRQGGFTFKNNTSIEKEELLNTFIKLSEVGADLSTVIRGTKLDASAASTSAAGVMLQNKMVEKVTEDNFTSIQGTGKFFSEDGILKMYKENAHDPVREAYAKFFPYFNESFEGLVTKFLETVPADAFLNDRVISNMFKHAETYHIANHDGLARFSTEVVMKSVHKAFIEFKRDYAASYPTLISALRLETQKVDPSLEEDRIVVNRSAISKDQINLAHEEWKAMMSNEENAGFARNLLAYALKTTGYTPSPFSIINLIHPDAFNETFGSEQSIEGRLESLLNNVDVPFDNFMSFYVRNVFKEDNSFLLKADEAAKEEDGTLVIKKVNGEVPSYYKNTIGNAVDFLIKRDKEGDRLFALDEGEDNKITYIEVSSLGTKFYRQDYTPAEESLELPEGKRKLTEEPLNKFEPLIGTTEKGEPSAEDIGTPFEFPVQENTVAKKTTFEEYFKAVESSTTKAQAFSREEWNKLPLEEQKAVMDDIKKCDG